MNGFVVELGPADDDAIGGFGGSCGRAGVVG